MLSVSEKYLQSIVGDTREMPYRVKLEGSLLLDKTKISNMSVNENIGGSEGVVLGTANSATLNFTLRNATPTDYNGMLVEPESGLTLSDGSIEWLPLGKFWVTDFTTSNDFKTVNFTCADGMYHMTGEYISHLTYPAHIRDVVHEIVAQSGVEFVEPSSWPDVVVRRKPEGLTHRDAIGHAAGCCGSNARFNRLGKLEFTWYNNSGVTISRKTQYLDGFTKLNYKPLEVNFEVVGQQETYAVSVISDGNGGITAMPGQNVIEGETVVLSVDPFGGYELATIYAETETGEAVTLYQRAEGGYSFVQPDSNVTVTASFRTSAEGPFKLTIRKIGNDGCEIIPSYSSLGNGLYAEGETVLFYIKPSEGFEIDKFVITPATLSLTKTSTQSGGAEIYEFVMPQSDVTINVYLKEETKYYRINRLVSDDGGYVWIQDYSTGEYIWEASKGTIVSVTFSPHDGYALDHYVSDVTLTQTGSNTYTFVMPEREVSITAYYGFSEDESKTGLYSWLQTPQAAPTSKPYWAVFYKESDELPTCQKYILVWFDSWAAIGYSGEEYTIQFNGYYYCGSKNNGHGAHEWDTSLWSGNGATGSTLEWDARIGEMYADWDSYYGPSTQYCLIASNVHLFRNSVMIFEKCENAIQSPQTSYVQDGMDIREKGSLAYWNCPDTFSTPAPAANWMILMPESGLYMTMGEDGKYDVPLTSYPKSLIAFYYDSITIQNLGAIFPNTDEVMYLASFTNAKWTYLRDNNLGWDEEIFDLPEGAVIGLRNPLVTTQSADAYLDGGSYNFAGVLVTNKTLYDSNGNLFMHNNACRICDCATATRMFSLKRSVSTDAIVIDIENGTVSTSGDAIVIDSNDLIVSVEGDTLVLSVNSVPLETEKVTISYTNPMIYEKMVEPISNLVQGVTYTPARVKFRGNPALQAGDIITAPDKDGRYHTILIMQQTMTFGGGMNAEISCPGKTAKTKSFSAVSPMTAQIKKEVQQSNVELEKRLASNNALVFNSMYKEIGNTESKIKSVVEWQGHTDSTIAEIEQVASENSGKIAMVVGQNGIVNEDGAVQGSVVIEAINGESTAKIAADRIELEGEKLDIKVDATNIEGKITADQINANGMQVTDGTFSGDLSVQHILLQDKEITVASDSGSSVKIVNITWHITKYIVGKDYLEVYATIDEPQSVDITGLQCGVYFDTGYSARYDYGPDTATITAGETKSTVMTGYNTDLVDCFNVEKYNGTKYVSISESGTVVTLNGTFAPSEDSKYSLGTANLKWGDVYSLSGTINTSDEREKNSISQIPQKYSDMFYKLNPILYKLNKGTSDRFHVGFSAQAVEQAMTECDITDKEFAGLIKSPQADGDDIYGLRYSEFIALAISEIQRLNKKITELEKQINER